MYYHGHGFGGWGWFAMSAGMILFWVLLVGVCALVLRTMVRNEWGAHRSEGPSAERTLADRFALGEIDADEYRSRLATLRGAGDPAGKD